MQNWHYLDAQNTSKQVPEERMESLVNSGEISPGTLLWKTGMADWTPASAVLPALFGGDADAPPPIRPSATPARRCHEIDYEIFGDDMQIVEVELDPGETVIAEAGAMNYMEPDITFEAKMGDGSQPNEG